MSWLMHRLDSSGRKAYMQENPPDDDIPMVMSKPGGLGEGAKSRLVQSASSVELPSGHSSRSGSGSGHGRHRMI